MFWAFVIIVAIHCIFAILHWEELKLGIMFLQDYSPE